METGKPGLASAPVLIGSIAEQTEKRMDIQSPLTAVYIQTVAAAVAPPPTPAPRPAATPEPPALHLPMPQLYSKETLPLLTLHIVGGLQSQPGLSLAAAAATPAAKARSAGKHVCPHCGRDCMKPSVLEKHLRCHTGERPYPCNTCGVSFKTQSNLYKHKRTQAHARLSYESEQSSVDSSSGSRDLHTPGSSLEERGREAGSPDRGAGPAQSARTAPPKLTSREELAAEPPPDDAKAGAAAAATAEERRAMDREKAPAGHARHLPLQRQEATLFSKQWESSVCRGKSQSHESTDSGFSESSDLYPGSAGLLLHEHSTDSLAESTPESAGGGGGGGPVPLKDPGREREQRSLEERISKLISENSALMEDKHLENVRPRKTVLSKQGSIDLPMPYTYKDSFHFDMRRAPNVASHRSRNPGLCSSVPTQRSGSVEHAPLTRSHSLPFSVSLLQPERASPSPAQRGHYATTARRGSAGQIHPGASAAVRPGGQHSPAHRPLVRQTAVDCNHATDALCASSSVEEAGCDGEPSAAKFRRKKAPKFAYNKWYMYGDGTFRKLYSADKGGESKGRKSANPESEPAQGLQKRSSALHKEPASPPAKLCALDFRHDRGSQSIAPLHRNLSLPLLPSPSAGAPVARTTERTVRGESERPSHEGALGGDRKKQRTEDEIACPVEMETDLNTPAPLSLSLPLPLPPLATTRKLETNLTFVNLQTNHAAPKEPLFPPALINANSRLVSGSPGAAATRPPLAANNNFLPKYQLKLPNATEPDSALTRGAEKPAGAEGSSAAPPSSVAVQTSSPALTPGQDPITSPSTCDKNASSQVPLPPAVATLSQGANAAANFAVLRSSPAETTITTTCLHDHRTRLCSASPLNQPPRPSAVQWLSPADRHTPAPSRGPPTAHAQEAAEPSNPGDRLGGPGSNPPAVPCHVVPFDSLQPAPHNVFHVHTADLQICLQIISDEQLALIEPQIERQASGAHSQKHDGGNVLSLQSKSPKAGLADAEAGGPQPNPQTQSLQHTESIKPPLSVRVGTPPPPPNLNVSQSAHPAPVSESAQPQQPPQALSLSKATPPLDRGSQVPLRDGQNKPRNQGGSCKESTITSTQTGVNATSCWTASSTDKCEIPRQATPHAAAHRGNPLESTSTGSADPSQHAEAEPSHHSQHGAGWGAPHHFTSGTSHVPPQRPTDTQHPTAGRRGGASPPGRAAPDQPQTGGHGGGDGGGTPAPAAVWPGSGPGSEAGEAECGGPGARDVGTAAGDGGGDGGASCIGGDAVAGRQRGDAPSECKHMVPSDTRETREEGGEVRRDLPQIDSGTHSETPPPAPPPFHFSGPQQSGGQQTTIGEQVHPPSTPSSSHLPQTSPQFDGGWRQTPTPGSLDTTLADVTAGYRGDCEEVMWSEAGGCGERAAPGRSVAAMAACSGEAIFLAAQLHGEQSGECLSGAVRPVPSCHGDGEDASSSDDEGKLIIEL